MVTITGAFLGTPSTTTVSFGGTKGTINSDNGSTLSVTSPAGTGTVDVTVTTGSGTADAGNFTYLTATTLSFSPTLPSRIINGTTVAIQVLVADQFSNALAGVPITITYPNGSGTKSAKVNSNSSGIAALRMPLSVTTVDASYTISASASGIPDITSTIYITGVAAKLQFAFPAASTKFSTTAGTTVGIPVGVFDANGQPVSINSTTVKLSISGTTFSTGATFMTTTTDATGLASFIVIINKANTAASPTWTLTATSPA